MVKRLPKGWKRWGGLLCFSIKGGRILHWSTVWLRSTREADTGRKSVRYWRLEPGPDFNTIAVAPGLGISGRFTVVERINNAREATTAWANRRT